MARLIVKSPYIKCGGGQSAGGYLKYIATRERVEIIPDDRPPTNKQEQLIAKLVEDFPDGRRLGGPLPRLLPNQTHPHPCPQSFTPIQMSSSETMGS